MKVKKMFKKLRSIFLNMGGLSLLQKVIVNKDQIIFVYFQVLIILKPDGTWKILVNNNLSKINIQSISKILDN